MIREFNYTHRQRIESNHLTIDLVAPTDGDYYSFDLEINLDNLSLPEDAPVFVEASRDNSTMRFSWGTAGSPVAPEDRRLTSVSIVPSFRVLVTTPDEVRRILASADGIRPQQTQSEQPGAKELVFLQEEDLEQEVWRLDMGEECIDEPVLKVNKNIEGISRIVRQDPGFRSLVFPEVMRAVFTNALLGQGEVSTEEGYLHDWLGFVSQFYHDELPGQDSYYPEGNERTADLQRWINGAVQAFTQSRFKASDMFTASRE